MTSPDPFRHHPELRSQIRPAAESYFRDMDMDALDARLIAAGQPPDWRTPCDEREAGRRAFLQGHHGGDLWVFGYGSLMWDPSVEFAEVRRAVTSAYQRSFCLWDTGGRGAMDQPGLMLALDGGGACAGLAFRIEAERLDHETFVLWRREMISHAYRPVFLTVETDAGPITAMAFVADHASDRIVPDVPIDQQAQMLAQAEGQLGTAFEYLDGVFRHLQLLQIEDGYIADLFARANALRAPSTWRGGS